MEWIDLFIEFCTNHLANMGIYVGIILVLLESIIPVFPLSVFIALNIITYGNIIGFISSWIATIIGCTLSFFIFRTTLRGKIQQYIKNKEKKELSKWLQKMSKISFASLAVVMAVPFTPAFLVNIAAGLSKMKYKKFLAATVIGKSVMVYFWGYIGTTLLESLTDITVIIKIAVLVLAAYILSKIVEKRLEIK